MAGDGLEEDFWGNPNQQISEISDPNSDQKMLRKSNAKIHPEKGKQIDDDVAFGMPNNKILLKKGPT